MGYKSAIDILPENLLDAVQKYIDGEYLYIPRKECNKKSWGELKKSKEYFSARNFEILEKHQAGMSAKDLSEKYYLSVKTIYKIVASAKSD
ncbi:Mor transcription activator family protein [Anaerobacterium chartisolvens]|uniref:Mor transcription activator family protein n=1 Tax=Anaerobacterium chartisolvens TaxID=1297424 RepID=A0A369BKH8_9FIRM|nr:CD3324 family protein [Anaerobacterium chartisolvens]RCX21086.1 Mor transcription activator family protein [Anaerobacterium chartisolvens]